ncbi:MAG: hypothetical protein E7316_07985 [Clostridiales bacterium]|nr:hypothetical protein [Clostridiales bacterium]
MIDYAKFDELIFFAKVKKSPGMFLGRKSLTSLRDQLFGMIYAFSICGHPDALKLFKSFIEYYNNNLFLTDKNGYVCWWNHLLYTSGGMDEEAFDLFYRSFESYLMKEHNLKLPEVE